MGPSSRGDPFSIGEQSMQEEVLGKRSAKISRNLRYLFRMEGLSYETQLYELSGGKKRENFRYYSKEGEEIGKPCKKMTFVGYEKN